MSATNSQLFRIPVAIAYNLFLDRFISDITGGAAK
jgi:hypothetical protein